MHKHTVKNRPIKEAICTVEDLITTERAAAHLGLRPKTLEFWRYQGVGPPWLRISRRCVPYRLRDLELWLQRLSILSPERNTTEKQ